MAHRIRKYVKRGVLAVVALAALVWTGDWLVLRHTVAQDGDAFGEIEVHYRYAVHLKNNRIEQDSSSKPAVVECVRSLFPHYDETPCWYVERHKDQFEELDASPWRFFRGE